MRRKTRHLHRLTTPRLVAATVLAVCTLAGPLPAAPAESEISRQITELVASPTQETDVALASVARKLADLGPETVPGILDYLERGTLGDGSETLTRWQRRAILRGLGTFRSSVVRVHVMQRATADALPRRRSSLLDVLGAIGRMRDVRTMVALATPPSGGNPLPWQVEYAFHVALGKILARDPDQVPFLQSVIFEASPDVRSFLVEALGEVHTIGSVQVLARCLGTDAELDGQLMREIRNSAPEVAGVVDDIALDRIRGYLDSEDTGLLRDAAHALGYLEDFTSAETLVKILKDHEDPHVRRAAHESLVEMTGLPFGEDAARWTFWLESEKEWHASESDETFRALRSASPLQILDGLNEACKHRLYRNRIAGHAASGLGDPRPQVRAKVCMALAQIGSPVVVPELIDRLDDADEAVRRYAWEALQRITRKNLPAEPQAWRDAFGIDDDPF